MKKSSQLLVILFIIGLGIYGVYARSLSISLTGSYGVKIPSTGSFLPDGNAGTVILMNESEAITAGIPGVTVLYDDNDSSKNNTLTGNLWLQTVGYVNLGQTTLGNKVSIVPPPGAEENTIIPWKVEGSAWSSNAGWISLESLDPDTYSGVYYIPETGAFTGLAYSKTLGYIDFSKGGGSTSENGLVARVKIIGNAGGLGVFESAFVSGNGSMKTSSVLTPFMNTLHKNVALLTRNATLTANKVRLGNLIYYKFLAGGSVSLSSEIDFCSADDKPRTIVVEGGDILINRDVTGSKKSCAIISLSNGTTGGNIFIADNPKVIDSFIIAEGSVYSGPSLAGLYNASKAILVGLPQRQLYIRGGVISRNTIGGAKNSDAPNACDAACPYNTEVVCDCNSAIKYDFNFFRNYTKKDENRAYTNSSLDDYSIIIELDSRGAGDPPPGF